jgi:hypothetical protein
MSAPSCEMLATLPGVRTVAAIVSCVKRGKTAKYKFALGAKEWMGSERFEHTSLVWQNL